MSKKNNHAIKKKLESALWYRRYGFSIIPTKKDKKPYIKWEKYQREHASEKQILSWWRRWPDANPAIVTGKISKITVVDLDSTAGKDAISEFLPENLTIPVVRTPHGWHYYFSYTPGIGNSVRAITDTDTRSDGGYVVSPPSQNSGESFYEWLPGLKISDLSPPKMPSILVDVLKQGTPGQASPSEHIYNKNTSSREKCNIKGEYIEGRKNDQKKSVTRPQQKVTKRNISFDKGHRDESLFTLAHHLVKSGMETVTIEKYLNFFAQKCNPPFPKKEVFEKIKSALKRGRDKNQNLTQQIRDWISVTKGNFSVTFLNNLQHCVTSDQKAKVRVILSRLVKEGLIERDDQRAGHYRIVSADCERMDYQNANDEIVDVWLPFRMKKLVYIMPGNIILLAGESNAGKTALLLNIIKYNQGKFKVHYFNSEMGAGELRKRLCAVDDMSLDEWSFDAYERNADFGDVIKPGRGNINVIDFLEIHDNFYEIGGRLAEIHQKLKGAIAFIALQKNKGVLTGLGGGRSLEKPRLYLSMSHEKLRIVKGKNWASNRNPNGLEVKFKIIKGCQFHQNSDWIMGDKDQTC